MSHCFRSHATDSDGARILAFPVRPHLLEAPPELPGLAYDSAENLIAQYVHLLERVVRLAPSLSDDHRITLLGHALALEHETLDPLQVWVERHRAFLSDLSAKGAKARRRRRKRVAQDIPKIA